MFFGKPRRPTKQDLIDLWVWYLVVATDESFTGSLRAEATRRVENFLWGRPRDPQRGSNDYFC